MRAFSQMEESLSRVPKVGLMPARWRAAARISGLVVGCVFMGFRWSLFCVWQDRRSL